jgi:hypothetical protein
MLWFDPELTPRVLLADRRRAAVTPERMRETPKDRTTHDVMTLLRGASALSMRDIEAAHERAVAEDAHDPPVTAILGELVVAFDERTALEATVGIATALGGPFRGVRDALDAARTTLGSEWAPRSSLISSRQQIREALLRMHHASVGVLDAAVERALLERRAFRTMTVLGADRLCFELSLGDGSAARVYLAAALRDVLPLYERLAVAVLAQIHERQDGADPSPFSLLLCAIARRASPPQRTSRRA